MQATARSAREWSHK